MAKILVLCGGDSLERRVSLASADAVADGLIEAGHTVVKLDSAKPDDLVPGEKHLLQGAVGVTPPEEALRMKLTPEGWVQFIQTMIQADMDCVFPILHGGWGEDGHIQAVLDLLDIPYLGCGALSSLLCMSKVESKRIARSLDVPVAEDLLIDETVVENHAVTSILDRVGLPCVIKPSDAGSAVDVFIIHDERELLPALETVRGHGFRPLVEQFIAGKELTVTILDGKAYPLVEIRPNAEFYDYTRKYTHGGSTYICPAEVTGKVAEDAKRFSEMLFRGLGCRHLARVDWRLSRDNELFFLEVNTIPGMTALSLVPMAAKEMGMTFSELMDYFVKLVIS